MKDDQFLVDAAEINREEISLVKLAQQKGGLYFVNELNKMMEDQHIKSLVDLTALAKMKKYHFQHHKPEKEKKLTKN